MGIDGHTIRLLLYAKSQGVSFAKTAMIGRQHFYLSAAALSLSATRGGFPLNCDQAGRLLAEKEGYAEPFLALLGASEIASFDASDYEGATHLHDFNRPIDESLKDRFTAVLDGGTLEHIFNYPVAIKNCMEMAEVGGHFLAITPANNYFGHGFYQFSPELFFRIFSPGNGFEIVKVILFESPPEADWFEVRDPEAVRERVQVVNSIPINLCVIARKVGRVAIFAPSPQQSDYVTLWAPHAGKLEANSLQRPFAKFKRLVPVPLKALYHKLRGMRKLVAPRYDPRFFKRMRIPP